MKEWTDIIPYHIKHKSIFLTNAMKQKTELVHVCVCLRVRETQREAKIESVFYLIRNIS